MTRKISVKIKDFWTVGSDPPKDGGQQNIFNTGDKKPNQFHDDIIMAQIRLLREFMTKKIFAIWNGLSPPWRFAFCGYFVTRIALTLWSLTIYSIFPVAIQNFDLFGEPILSAFVLQTSERYVYSRQVNDTILSFHVADPNHVTDNQTGSIWSLRDGKAVQGKYSGSLLQVSTHSVEAIFPYVGMKPAKDIVFALWQRFDANWYLKIATRGYGSDDGSTVYFPFYPMLIRVLALFMNPIFAATLISNLALIGDLGLLYSLTATQIDDTIAHRTATYFLLFPTAFFLTAPYTESLFLFFVLASFLSASRGRWGWSVIWAALSALTRLQGVLLIIPLAYMLWREARNFSLKAKMLRAALLLVIPLATISFLTFTNLSLLNTYQTTLNARFVLPWNNILAAFSLLLGGKGSIVDALNLVFTFVLIFLMFGIWKKLPVEYFLYSLPMLAAPMFRMTTSQPLVSMVRYGLVIFPIFIVLSIWGKNEWINRAIVYLSLLLQLYLSAQFILWGWVG